GGLSWCCFEDARRSPFHQEPMRRQLPICNANWSGARPFAAPRSPTCAFSPTPLSRLGPDYLSRRGDLARGLPEYPRPLVSVGYPIRSQVLCAGPQLSDVDSGNICTPVNKIVPSVLEQKIG